MTGHTGEPDMTAASLVGLGPPPATDHGAPDVGVRTPTAWRGHSQAWRWRAWQDLASWICWLVWAYALEGSDEGWSRWWTSPGAVEQLVALREWHRELVDVEVAETRPEGMDDREASAREIYARRSRLERGRDWVYWHDALERVAQRIAGRDGADLVARHAAGGSPARARRAEQLRREEDGGFAEFLRELAAAGEVGHPVTTPALAMEGLHGGDGHV